MIVPSNFLNCLMETDDDVLAHPQWLQRAVNDQKSLWESWPLLVDREQQRKEASTRSRDFYDARDREDNPFSVWTGTHDDNVWKNRFGIEAYDRNRVIIGDPDRYVNASYVREGAGGRWWVAAEVRFLGSLSLPILLVLNQSSHFGRLLQIMLSTRFSPCSSLPMKTFQMLHGSIPLYNLAPRAKAHRIRLIHTSHRHFLTHTRYTPSGAPRCLPCKFRLSSKSA